MKKLLLALLAALAPAVVMGQTVTGNLTYKYDVDSTSLTYCALQGKNGDIFADPHTGTANIKTTGSSTTVTEFTASTNPFTDLSVGDTIIVQDNAAIPVTQRVIITAKASAASITVDTALTLTGTSGHPFRWLKSVCGTTVNDGWATVSSFPTVAMTVQYDQGDLGSLRVRWECKGGGIGAAPVIVYPGESSDCGIGGTLSTDRCDFVTAGVTARLTVLVENNPFSYCRVGLAYATSDASDAGANVEQVTTVISKVK